MKAIVYLIFSALMWGANFHLLKIMLLSVHFVEAGFWRYLFGVIVLALYVKKNFPTRHIVIQHIKGILVIGVLGIFCFNILLFWGLLYTSPLNASLIISLNPIVTLFLAYFFLKSKISSTQLIGACIGCCGVIYLVSKGNVFNLPQVAFSKGDILILCAMILSSFYHIWVKKYAVNISNHHFTFLTNLVCLVLFVIILPFFMVSHAIDYTISFWMTSVTFGALGTAVTYMLWNKGLGFMGASKAGVFMNIVPLSTAILSVLLGQALNQFHIISGLMIILGLLISHMKLRK